MKKHFNYDFINKTIVGSMASITRANKGKEPEYSELTSMMVAQPTFTLVPKVIEQKPDKKTHANLSFKRMEAYINLQSDSEALLKEFNAVKKKAHVLGADYPMTKKWFLAKFPELKTQKNSGNSDPSSENDNNQVANSNEEEA